MCGLGPKANKYLTRLDQVGPGRVKVWTRADILADKFWAPKYNTYFMKKGKSL